VPKPVSRQPAQGRPLPARAATTLPAPTSARAQHARFACSRGPTLALTSAGDPLRDTRAALRRSRQSARPLAAASIPELAAVTSGCLGRNDSGLLHVERASLATSASPQSRQRRPRAMAQYASHRDRRTLANTVTVAVLATTSAPPSTSCSRDRGRSQTGADVRRAQHAEHDLAARGDTNSKMPAAAATLHFETPISPCRAASAQRL
jgi:hypothetical protein